MCCRRVLVAVSKAAMLFVALRLAGIPCSADEHSAEQGRIPPAAIERLRIVVTEKAPDVEITVDDDDLGGGCRFVERCQQYRVHGVKGQRITDGFKKESWRELGPMADGFLLKLNWKAKLDGGAGGLGWTPVFAWQYWRQYSHCYKLPGDQGYVVMTWHYGSRTDMTILESVLTELAAFGEPVYDVEKHGWDEKSARLQKGLTDILEKYQS